MTQLSKFHEVEALEEKDIQFLLKNCEKLKRKKTRIKYKAIILIMLRCGLRVSETCNLQMKHFNFKKGKHGTVIVESLKKGISEADVLKAERMIDLGPFRLLMKSWWQLLIKWSN